MIKYAVFDLDGVLLNTAEGIRESARYTAKVLGYPDLSESEWNTFAGPPVQKSFADHFGCTPEEAQEAANIFRDYYKEDAALFLASPYDGIYDLLSALKKTGVKTAVATYKREDYALKILKHFGFHEYFDSMHGADNENKLSKGDIVNMCIEEIGADKDITALIGDTDNDAVGAEKAGVKFIGVTYGFGFKTKEDVDVFSNIGYANDPMGLLKFFSE